MEELRTAVEQRLKALPNFKYKRENGKYNDYPHQYNATYFSACCESPRVRFCSEVSQQERDVSSSGPKHAEGGAAVS